MAIFRPEDEERIRERFAALERPVVLVVALGPEETPLAGHADVDFGAETVRIVEELCTLSDRVTCRVEHEPPGLERFPAVLICPEGDDAGLRYDGLPWGHELGSLVGAVLEAGRAESSLRPESLEALAGLDRDLTIDVFVTPT
jgi:alkyl hydroperoxide reductase subunit F